MKTPGLSYSSLAASMIALVASATLSFKPATPCPKAELTPAGIQLNNRTNCAYSIICTWGTSCSDNNPCVNCFTVSANGSAILSTCGGSVLHSIKICCDGACANQSGVAWSGCGGSYISSGGCNPCHFTLSGDDVHGFTIS